MCARIMSVCLFVSLFGRLLVVVVVVVVCVCVCKRPRFDQRWLYLKQTHSRKMPVLIGKNAFFCHCIRFVFPPSLTTENFPRYDP